VSLGNLQSGTELDRNLSSRPIVIDDALIALRNTGQLTLAARLFEIQPLFAPSALYTFGLLVNVP